MSDGEYVKISDLKRARREPTKYPWSAWASDSNITVEVALDVTDARWSKYKGMYNPGATVARHYGLRVFVRTNRVYVARLPEAEVGP